MEACVQSPRHAAAERGQERHSKKAEEERDKQMGTPSAKQTSKAWWPHCPGSVFTTETAGNTEGFCLILGDPRATTEQTLTGPCKRDFPSSAAYWVLSLLLLLLCTWLLSVLLGGLVQEHCWDLRGPDKWRPREHNCLPNAWLLYVSTPACMFK